MWKYLLAVGVIALFFAAGAWTYTNYLAPGSVTPTAPAALAEQPAEELPLIVSAEGRVTPVDQVTLAFGASGLVEEVLFSRGDLVEAGEVIARLEGAEKLAAALSAAELEQLAAQQALDELSENNNLAAAQALQEIANARDALRDATRRRDNLGTASPQADIDQAQANVVLARDRLDKAREDFEPYQNKPADNLLRASFQSKLAQAQKDYDAAVQRLNNLQGTGDDIEISQSEADMAMAQARLDAAEKDYEILKAGPDPDQVALAEARLANADAQVAAARAALDDLELKAPITGSLVGLDIKPGEFAVPGAPVVSLADLTHWKVETIDLAESDVALIATGMPAQISLDAFSGQSLPGVVREIELAGEDLRGNVTYTAYVDLDPQLLPIRWGMTAFVDIEIPEE